jgi:hypothetical protein
MENANMQMPGGQGVGQKRLQPEEVKGGLDARDLIGRFRSKADIYNYLSLHRKKFAKLTVNITRPVLHAA